MPDDRLLDSQMLLNGRHVQPDLPAAARLAARQRVAQQRELRLHAALDARLSRAHRPSLTWYRVRYASSRYARPNSTMKAVAAASSVKPSTNGATTSKIPTTMSSTTCEAIGRFLTMPVGDSVMPPSTRIAAPMRTENATAPLWSNEKRNGAAMANTPRQYSSTPCPNSGTDPRRRKRLRRP